MADPIAALATARRFRDFASWTRSMEIDFVRGGDSDLQLRFEFSEAQEKAIAAELAERGRATPKFEYAYYNDRNEICTRITNTVAIRPVGYLKARSPPADSEEFGSAKNAWHVLKKLYELIDFFCSSFSNK